MDLIDRIDRWADVCPDRVAHRSGSRTITWRQLRRGSDAAARAIRTLAPDDASPLAIQGQKEPEMLIGFLGALKAGHPYVPLDTTLPCERVERIIAISGAKLLLTVDKIAAMGEAEPLEARPPLCGDAVMYILFTSGSTGEPKGVPITVGNVENFTTWMADEQRYIEQQEVFLNQAPFSFDVSVMDTYGALLSGGTLFSITPAMREDHRAMHEALRKSGVTVWVSTPSFVRLCAFDEAFNAKSLPALRKVIVCGEILPAALAAEMMDRFPNTEIWNSYGPTETTVVMTSILITREVIARGEPLPVGWPMPGARVLIRDTEDRDLPEGEQGEIIIAGACVSPGYIGRPELRAQAFFKIDGEQAYRSGDLGRMIGGLVFCDGRKDDQVKVRGFRIELAEVTGALRSHPGVRDAAVIAHEDGTGERELVAYVVGNATSRQMRTHLASQLPDYMVPAHFVTLPALPLTRNGKVDRKQLPDPSADRLTSSLEVIPPVDSVQMRLVEMWERILEVTPVGIDDDFYELGGHSLRAAEFMVQVEKTFGRHVPLSELFKAPTIEQFARVLAATPPDANWPIIEQIRASGSRPPFFCVPGFLDLTRHLSAEQPCYGVHLAVMETMPDPTTGVRDMARKCVEEIRVLQPEGPYAIGGHSFGAVVAYEIAQQLRALGQPVAQLVLIDPDPPRPLATGTLGYHVNRYAFHVRQLLQLSGEDRWAYLRQRFRIGSARLSNSLEKRLARYAPAEGEVFEEAARHYYPQPYDSPVTMLLARDTHLRTRLANDPRMAWCELVSGGIEIQDLPGDHYTLVREPNVSRLAKRLTVALYGAVEKPAAGSFR